MSTNVQIIKDALLLLNLIGETEDPSAEQGATMLRLLNQMMELWEENDIKLQYYEQTNTTATFPCPAYSEIGVAAALAIMAAPNFGASISPELQERYRQGYEVISRKAVQRRMKESDMRHVPGPTGRRSDIFEG